MTSEGKWSSGIFLFVLITTSSCKSISLLIPPSLSSHPDSNWFVSIVVFSLPTVLSIEYYVIVYHLRSSPRKLCEERWESFSHVYLFFPEPICFPHLKQPHPSCFYSYRNEKKEICCMFNQLSSLFCNLIWNPSSFSSSHVESDANDLRSSDNLNSFHWLHSILSFQVQGDDWDQLKCCKINEQEYPISISPPNCLN